MFRRLRYAPLPGKCARVILPPSPAGCEISLGSLDRRQLFSRRYHQELVYAGAVRFGQFFGGRFQIGGVRLCGPPVVEAERGMV